MKKRKRIQSALSITLSLFMLLSLTAPSLAKGVAIKGEPDGQNKSTVMEEHFYSGSLEPNFTSDSVEVTTDSYSMYFSGAYHYGSALVLTAYTLKDYNRFTFSIETLQSNDAFVYLGIGGAEASDNISLYDYNLCVAKNVTALYEMKGMSNWVQAGNAVISNVLAEGTTTDFGIVIEKVSGNNFKVTFEILEDGEPIFTTDYGTTIRLDNPNGYVSMWGGINEVFNVKDFKVYDSPTHVAFEDDFSNSSLTYGDEAVGDSNWHINDNRYTRDEVFISRNAGPEFKEAGDMITATSPLVFYNDVSKPFEISYKARIEELGEKSVFGIYLGATEAGSLENATIIGVSAKDDKTAVVHLIKDGEIVDYGDTEIPLSALSIDDIYVDYEVDIHNDYTVYFSVAGIKFEFINVDYDGFWGICNYSLDGAAATQARLDEVTVVKNTYVTCAEPDLSNDFGGIKTTIDGFQEYYISDRTYFMGPGVSLRPKGAFTVEPSLYFENTGPYSSFTPKQPYTDFILQFDLKMVSEGTNGMWFGVNFGKPAFASVSEQSTSVYFEYYGWSGEPYTQMVSHLCAFDDGEKAKKIEGYHFFKDQETKYNFMIVAKNRTVYVYFKEDSEDISELSICRAVIPNVNTNGYLSIFGINGLSFDIFNYKLTNLSPDATGDSAIALRENFEEETLSDKLQIVGSAAAQEGCMKLSGGSLETINESHYYIADFTILEANQNVVVEFSKNKSMTFSKDLKKITLKDGKKKTVFDVAEYDLSAYKNTQFQLILQGDSLTLSAKGVYEPNDKFSSPIVEYTFAKTLDEGILRWSSDDASIDDIAVYYLDHTYKAASVSYEEDPNDTEMWIKKDVILGGEEQGATTESETQPLFVVLYVVIGAIILALLGVIIAMYVKKRGKEK